MRVDVLLSPLEALPQPTGAHELAWSYLLDALIADAHTAKLSALHVCLPTAQLAADVKLRARLTGSGEQGDGIGVALFGLDRKVPENATRLYSLEFGLLAAPALRQLRRETAGWRLEAQLSVYSVAARLWGVPIRLAATLGAKHLSDRAMAAMRRTFASSHRLPAFYHLSVWTRA